MWYVYIHINVDFLGFGPKELVMRSSASPIHRWVENVNTRVAIENGEVRMRNHFERADESFSPKGIVMTRDSADLVDLMIQGPCSRDVTEAPHSLDWFREILAEYPETRKVALYPFCCGGDYSRHQATFRRQFPNLTFTFLNVPDLYEVPDHHCDDVVRAAVKAGILGIAKLE